MWAKGKSPRSTTPYGTMLDPSGGKAGKSYVLYDEGEKSPKSGERVRLTNKNILGRKGRVQGPRGEGESAKTKPQLEGYRRGNQ